MSKQLLSTISRMERTIARARRQLSDLEAGCMALQELARTGAANGVARSARGAKDPERRARGQRSPELPATGREVWLKVLGSGERTARQIVDRALARLSIGEEGRVAITSRAANWLNGAVKNSLVEIVGQRDGVNVYKKV
jgi:polyribonucleotide nucleotidyltransferase